MARIVRASNFNLDWYNEEFILWPMPKEAAEEIAAAINKHQHSTDSDYFKVVDNDYKLYIGMEP